LCYPAILPCTCEVYLVAAIIIAYATMRSYLFEKTEADKVVEKKSLPRLGKMTEGEGLDI